MLRVQLASPLSFARRPVGLAHRRSCAQCLQQFRFDFQLGAVVLQFGPHHQEGVLDPFAQRADLGQQHRNVVTGQHQRHSVKQTRPVTGGNAQQPALRFFIGLERHARGHRKAFHPT